MGSGRFIERARGGVGKRLVLIAALALAVSVALGIGLATGATTIPTPEITEAPKDPTGQTQASFRFTDSQAGVSFKCQIDGNGYTPCTSPISYGPQVDGVHKFQVQAEAGGKTSPAATYKWTLSTAPPTPTITFPASGGIYNASGWAAGCSPAGICGKVKDTQAVTAVTVSIRQGNGKWWGGSSFNESSEKFNAAALEAPNSKNTAWNYPLSLPPNGSSYTVHVRATDELGNTNSAANQAETTFTIDTVPPPAPTVKSGPEQETSEKTATFTFSDSEAGVSFLCSRDEAKFASCSSPKEYEAVGQGEHRFQVEARDAAGNVSSATSYAWSVFTKTFTIEGNLTGELSPGATKPLQLKLLNTNTKALIVTGLQVTVQSGSSKAGCDGPTNLQITQSNATSSNTVTIPAKGQITVPSGSVTAPQVLMRDLPTNQDACKGATFTFSYSGSAHS